MKTVKIIPVLVLLLSLSFQTKKPQSAFNFGTYGICDCEQQDNKTPKIQLSIKEDFSFHYTDNSVYGKALDIKGNWERKGNAIRLKNYKSTFPVHNFWKIDRNEKCLKSRKGLEFERLCLIKACK